MSALWWDAAQIAALWDQEVIYQKEKRQEPFGFPAPPRGVSQDS